MRLIDADKVAEAIDWLNEYDFVIWHDVMECIDKVPIVDAESIVTKHEDIGYEKGYRDGYAEALEVTEDAVRHGHWIGKEDQKWHCSECDGIAPKGHRYDYCPNCGAKMDGGTNETV